MMGETKESDRVQDSLKMLNYGYQAYDMVRFYKPGQVIETARIYKGAKSSVTLGVNANPLITVPKGAADKMKPVVERTDPLLAPLAAGQSVGTIKVQMDGKDLTSFPLVALEAVPQAGLLGRLWDSAMLSFNKKK
jgi:D-alanyl-D-alanine carboxypeptidase (penicillin-binding protein 5/6)